MLTVMCPNCRHRFPAPGCCTPNGAIASSGQPGQCTFYPTTCSSSSSSSSSYPTVLDGGILVPRGYSSGGGCFINAPTIINSPTIIQGHPGPVLGQAKCSAVPERPGCPGPSLAAADRAVVTNGNFQIPPHCQIVTTCDLTGGSVTITTPSIQSGGCLIQSSGRLVHAPQIELRPKLSDGGCLVQKQTSTDEEAGLSGGGGGDDAAAEEGKNDETRDVDVQRGLFQNPHPLLFGPPSGCQELPGARRSSIRKDRDDKTCSHGRSDCNTHSFNANEHCQCSVSTAKSVRSNVVSCCDGCRAPTSVQGGTSFSITDANANASTSSGTVIQVNATVQLPANVGHCTVSITATANSGPGAGRSRNNFNGGGIVQPDILVPANSADREDNSPTTPVSWLVPSPWSSCGPLSSNGDLERLTESKRVLQVSGWYHEGLSWQQSANLLKNAPVGYWLMRDSSDKRFMFAVSVQTPRGPTSVRVHYLYGRFRLDAEPRLAQEMPMFDCPIRMIEHYVEYSKKMDQQREVWVDHSGQLYSQIYLTMPLMKEVRSLSHLARLAVNRNRIATGELPALLREYIAEYPYSQ